MAKHFISIRPNLNAKGETTIHAGRLGRKLDSVRACTILCSGVVVRNHGRELLVSTGEKSVHAALVGELVDLVPTTPGEPIKYDPARGVFHLLTGELFTGGGVVTADGWRYFLHREYTC